jgi:gamma-glutamyltranspeptidase/glutathione hydrolase
MKANSRICTIRIIEVLTLLYAVGTARAGDVKDKPVEGRHGMVVTVSPLATDVGVSILQSGGNAVDAAVATAFTLAVTWPAAGNIGGGGFMLVYPSGDKPEPVVFDYRETAPGAATKDMFKGETSWYNHPWTGPGTCQVWQTSLEGPAGAGRKACH